METALVRKTLKKLGFKPLGGRHKNANGPDLFAIKGDKAFSIEIKKAVKPSSNKPFKTYAVEPARKNDDLIAIVFPCGYVLIEPMKHHLSACGPKGTRSFGPLT